jgi:hypothetical protein
MPDFRFHAPDHSYWLGTERLPSVTTLLQEAGLVDTRWFTDEARERGTAVHHATAAYDLGALHPDDYTRPDARPFLLAYVAAMEALRPAWTEIEVPRYSAQHRFAGRPDRLGVTPDGRHTVLEIKTGARAPWHGVQLALQAILWAGETGLAPRAHQRLVVYLGASGRFRVVSYTEIVSDFDTAWRVLACAA